jgi:hypothetical protein
MPGAGPRAVGAGLHRLRARPQNDRPPGTPSGGSPGSLVDAFRTGARFPVEKLELETTLTAIEASDLNAFSFVDPERARAQPPLQAPRSPSGVCPTSIKVLKPMTG